MGSYASDSSNTGPRCNNVLHLEGSVLNLLVTLYIPFLDGLVLSTSVWFVAII